MLEVELLYIGWSSFTEVEKGAARAEIEHGVCKKQEVRKGPGGRGGQRGD